MKFYHCIYIISFVPKWLLNLIFNSFPRMKVAQWIRHWSAVLAASQGGQHPQLDPDVSTMIFHQGSMPRAAKGESEDRRKPPKRLSPESGL